MKNILHIAILFLSVNVFCVGDSIADDRTFRSEVTAALKKSATFFRTQAAYQGGYVYYYYLDLKQRWGEGIAGPSQIWVQPPGTPTVGIAFLKAYRATGDRFYLDAATDAANALVYGQLKSGGWTNLVDFNPRSKTTALYRNGKGRGKNNSTLDDGISQGAIRLLMQVDQAHKFKNKKIHDSVQIALAALLKAHYPNGAFPQVWTTAVKPQPVLKASMPSYDWRTEGRIKNYWDMYTLNDGLAGTVSETLLEAYSIYEEEKYKTALIKLGDFLILAQLPEPQPAWAQQYGFNMHPIWARKFEPPGITGGESQDAIETLMKIYRLTKNEKYLEPIPRAIKYLNRSLLPDGQLARYYALKTNRPLYMKRQGKVYSLTYDDSDLPRHYGWKITSRLNELNAAYRVLKTGKGNSNRSPSVAELKKQAQQILQELDSQGRWINIATSERLIGQPKFPIKSRYIASETFSKNIETLSDYLLASQ